MWRKSKLKVLNEKKNLRHYLSFKKDKFKEIF